VEGRLLGLAANVATLSYLTLASLDGYVADEQGTWDWAAPDEQVHELVNELQRPVGTHLYGRRMYEVLVAWETLSLGDQPSFIRDYAEIWRSADKVVYSSTLEAVSSARTRIERSFEPEIVREMKATADRDLWIGGPNLAAQALRAGLVDEVSLFLAPVIVGGGTPALPDGVRVDLELMDERRFDNGFVYVRYRVER
jgi:dihydrofolate reductase